MVRIPCHLRKFIRERLFPFVPFIIRFSRFSGVLEALIDTGSPHTVLSTKDALKLKLPIKKWRGGEPISLAGFRFFNHPISNVTITFRKEDNNSLQITVPKMGVLIPTKINRKVLEEVKHIPSIIGNDFLEEQKFALYYNPSGRIAYLERE